jgi:tetratricopeptide (TPR) repeat protein
MLAEMGLLGAATLTAFAIVLVGRFRRRLESARDVFGAGLAMGAAGACVAVLVHSFLDFNLRIPSNALVFSSLAGLAAAGRGEDEPYLKRWTSAAAALVFLLCGGLAIAHAWGERRLEVALRLSDPNVRIAALDAALRADPYLSEGFRERGLAWLTLAGGNEDPLDRGRLARAKNDLSRSVSLRPAWGEAWSDLGWVLYRMGFPQDASVAFDRSVELDPTNVRIGIVRAEFRARRSGPGAGIQDLVRLEHLNPDWSPGSAAEIAGHWTDDHALLDRLRD